MNPPTTLTPDEVRAYPVLCVDDEPANLQVFQRLFSETFTTYTASSGKEALQILAEHEVAVLFVDHRMPGLSGVDLCEHTRLNYPDIKRVLVTAYSGREMAIDAINRGGVHHFLTKPWKWHEVLQLLHGLIATTHLQRMVGHLRAAVLDKERQAALSITRRGYLHDLAGVSGVLGISCDMVKSQVQKLGARVGDRALRSINAELDRMGEMIEHLCAVHRRARDATANGSPALHEGSDLIGNVVALCQPELPYGVVIHQEATGEIPFFADRIDVVRVLLNLLHNACQAIQRSGIGANIFIGGRLEHGAAMFYVTDDGPGLPSGMHERVFDFECTTRRTEGGQGVGLYVSRQLAEANGGSLIATRSEVGGARFELRVPISPDDLDDLDDLDDIDTIVLEK